MAIRKLKANHAGRRSMSVVDYSSISKVRPLKSLTGFIKNAAGRDSSGKIAVRHRGGGHKRLFRAIDFVQLDKNNIPARVSSVEYDPNRSAFIALLVYNDGEKRYVLAEETMKVDDVVMCAEKAKIMKGNRMKIKNIPEGYEVFNIELHPGKGGAMARGAGNSVRLASLEGEMAQIVLPSGEQRYISKDCYATIGKASNIDHMNEVIGKAGRNRWKRKRPEVRGKVMNPVDHPHGGGEGSNSIGLKYPKTPWGKPALGVKTRMRKASDKMIIKRRKK